MNGESQEPQEPATRPADDIGQVAPSAPPSPANPKDRDAINEVAADLPDAADEVDSTVAELLAAVEGILTPEYSAVSLMLHGSIGRVDTELTAITAPIERVLERVTDGALREIITSSGELAAVGMWIPYDAETTAAAVADETGEAILAAMSGEHWSAPNAPALAPAGEEPEPQPEPEESHVPAEPVPPTAPTAGMGHAHACTGPTAAPFPTVPTDANTSAAAAALVPPASSVKAGCCPPNPCCPPVVVTCPAPAAPEEEEEGGGGGGGGGGGAGGRGSGTEEEEEGGGGGGGGGGAGGGAPPPPPPPPAPPPPAPPPRWVGALPPRFLAAPTWADPGVCQQIAESLRLYSTAPLGGTLAKSLDGSFLSETYKAARASLQFAVDWLASGGDTEAAKAAAKNSLVFTGEAFGGWSMLANTVEALPPKNVPLLHEAWSLGQRIAAAAHAEESTKFPLSYLTQSYTYLYQAANPQFIPSQAELDGLVVRGLMPNAQWKCLTRAHGIIPELQELVVDAARWTYSPFEVVQLSRRGMLDRTRFEHLMTRAGVDIAEKETELYKLTEALPGPSDLIRLMVRDAADDAVASEYGYDTDFVEKLDGRPGTKNFRQMRKWMEAHGITEETMRFYWRAHWEIPSPTALYEMLHRLRPDRPEVEKWHERHPAWKRGDPMPAGDPRPTVTTAADIAEALRINDMAPGFVERMMAISYHPVNRTDAIDAYHAGAWNEQQLYHAMRDNGYNEADAWRLVDIQQVKAGRRRANVGAGRTIRQILADYKDGIANGIATDGELRPLIPDPAHRAAAIRAADTQVHARVMRTMLKRVRRAYFVGEWDAVKVRGVLQARGIDPARIGQLLFEWDDERTGRYKEPTVRLLIQWAQLGLITADDAEQRALNLGYSPVDARRIVMQGIDARQQKIVAAVEKAKANVQRALKTAKQLAKEDRTELEKMRKENEKQIERLQKQQEKLQKELEKRQQDE